ncbi:Zn-dependent hydrolase [Komagataeibacter oboediens]|uniref:Zn-dependent hydrolase n=1 Tax=Komagataeibacter oboediens TaxID=65958 RepID=UPI001903DF6E|nr:Zn-dependent hydrolase [Komagataeibacter oboediens]GCE81750.1 N-carbamyl-L-amino acid amidohydrolase [Komagataeibacter oboediens]
MINEKSRISRVKDNDRKFLTMDIAKQAKCLFEELAALDKNNIGINRLSYGKRETAALDIIEHKARCFGLHTYRDCAANLVVVLEGTDPALPVVCCGSHMDSVPQGGNYDGAAGIIAGLLAIAHLKTREFRPRRSIHLLVLRGEESAAFGIPYIGSSLLFGLATGNMLDLTDSATGRPLRECLYRVGADVDNIEKGTVITNPGNINIWLELHIEQGPYLVNRNEPAAVVTSIRGNRRYRNIMCIGQGGHSGTVPNNLRHDPLLAVSELLVTMERKCLEMNDAGHDIVHTTGLMGTNATNQSITRIPDTVSFSFEMRSDNIDTLSEFDDFFKTTVKNISLRRGVTFSLGTCQAVPPVTLDPDVITLLSNSFSRNGLQCTRMPSGAGHDTGIFTTVGIPSGMIFVRNRNGSHTPDEHMEISDFLLGQKILADTIKYVANS